jgi:hypothetical protein
MHSLIVNDTVSPLMRHLYGATFSARAAGDVRMLFKTVPVNIPGDGAG